MKIKPSRVVYLHADAKHLSSVLLLRNQPFPAEKRRSKKIVLDNHTRNTHPSKSEGHGSKKKRTQSDCFNSPPSPSRKTTTKKKRGSRHKVQAPSYTEETPEISDKVSSKSESLLSNFSKMCKVSTKSK